MNTHPTSPSGSEPVPGWTVAPNHPREVERLVALSETGLVGGASDPLQEAVVKLASQICGTPISAVSLVDADRQWFSASVGMDVRETPRDRAFCAHVLLASAPFVVPDTHLDDRFVNNPLVTGSPGIRFYAGIRLEGGDDLPLGSLCVVDTVPRKLTTEQLDGLTTLGSLVGLQLELIRRNKQLIAQNLAQSEIHARLTKISSCLPGVIYQFRRRPDGTTCFPYASDRVQQIFNVSPEQIRNDSSAVFALIHPDDAAEIAVSIDESARSLTEWKGEFRIRSPRGAEEWVFANSIPEREPDGSTLWHGFATQITDRKAAEACLMRLNAELHIAHQQAESANRAKSAFLANMSHEIRTPLTAILGFADLLSEARSNGTAPPDSVQSIETIRSAGTHLLAIINDILDLSKIEADRLAIETIDTSPLDIVREVVELLRPKAEGKGLSLSAVLKSPAPTRIASDPTRLRQILMNLAGNAVKFTEAGSVSIAVGVGHDGSQDQLVIEVTDTGIGMTADAASRLFLPFGQGDETMTRRFGGTGLGLTICHRLARLMGGSVRLHKSEIGGGSCFRLSLPLQIVPGSVMATTLEGSLPLPSSAPVAAGLAGRILLAEDGPDNQRLISFHLRKAGATVSIAGNGKLALEMIHAARADGKPFDLLLTDIQMPEMDGYTLTRALRSEGSLMPIVALTAHALPEDRLRCLASGCDGYLSKPIDKAMLLATCGHWMVQRSESRVRTDAA